jgi:hypothetical protein
MARQLTPAILMKSERRQPGVAHPENGPGFLADPPAYIFYTRP